MLTTGRCKLQTVFCVSTRKYATDYLLHLLARREGGGRRKSERDKLSLNFARGNATIN